VNALKALARDPVHGEAITALLDASPIWAAYRDQRHDLFLTNTAVAGYLTGPTAQVAGYLMVCCVGVLFCCFLVFF
jgi:DnaJ family protein C protein 13